MPNGKRETNGERQDPVRRIGRHIEGEAAKRNQRDGAEKDISQRKAPRLSIEAMVKLRRRGRHNFTMRVFDLSKEGCKLEFLEAPQIDETVWLKFEGLEAVEATVRWLDVNTAGVEFGRPLHPAVFDLLVNRLR